MDFGYLGKDTLWLAEHGILTMVYQSTSYLTDRVPELGFADLPFLFGTNEEARAAMDGALGAYLTRKTEERISYRVMGYFENGFRHISNRLRPIRTPGDMAGMKIRVLPSMIHARTFELLGAEPHRIDLTEAIEGVASGTLDAQENPFANTVTYGVPEFHPYHTESSHFYLSRGLFANRDAVDGLPADIRDAFHAAVAEAIPFQRALAVEEELLGPEENRSRPAETSSGCPIRNAGHSGTPWRRSTTRSGRNWATRRSACSLNDPLTLVNSLWEMTDLSP